MNHDSMNWAPASTNWAPARGAPTINAQVRRAGPQRNRRSIRLQGYDYSQAGAYFITICTQNRECLFGEIINGEMRLNTTGQIAADQWYATPQRFADIELDEFVVMPNHIHGIFVNVGAPLAGAQSPGAQSVKNRATARVAPTVGGIIGAYKSLCVHHGLKWIKQNEPNRILGKMWQRNYWEHIVRNEPELNRIREYIHNNPAQWELDKLIAGTEIREPVTEYGMEAWMV